jgi:2-polyprenyl-6-methoxyphenol hydroxylase-like FAD-dependent oxidoreductase
MRSMDIAIAGAGIGGLAAAALLLRAGHRVTVYEQAERFARVGSGIQMAPNAMKVLRWLGVEQRLVATGFQAEFAISRTWDSGAETSRLELGDAVAREFGAPYLFLHRADLHAAIADIVPPEVVRFSHRLSSVREDRDGVTLGFEGGARERADLLVGADGVHSRVREILLGPERPRYTGRVAYRTVLPAERVRGLSLEPVRTKWWGPDRHMVVYFVSRNRDQLYFVTSVPEPAEWATPESWSSRGELDELRAAYAGFHPEVQALLDACPEVWKWALFERDPLARWSSERVVLLGDACHPMTPYMAQGAASALEDAAVLARCLDEAQPGSVHEAFVRYERIRKPRASTIQAGSSANNWLRDRADPGWVYGYDACTVDLEAIGAG